MTPRRAPGLLQGRVPVLLPAPGSRTGMSWPRRVPPRPALHIGSKTVKSTALHQMQYRSLSAAAAGGAAAFADVAAAGGAHLRAAVEAERCVGGAALLGL